MTEAQTSPTHGIAVAIIPARGGSKGLPGKNVMRVGGVPLVARAVAAARAARSIGLVAVTTDDDEIARVARDAGAVVVHRPAELAGDTASSESALLHALDELREGGGCDGVDGCDGTDGHPEASATVFIQATSPFISPTDLDAAVAQIATGERDSVFSAVPSHTFLWADAPHGGASGVNHDPAVRPRRQDRAAEYRETGAFYAMRTDGFRGARHRFFGRIGVQLVPDLHAVEIDTAADLIIAQSLANLIDHAAYGVDVDAVLAHSAAAHSAAAQPTAAQPTAAQPAAETALEGA
jgi:CMP-N-acetylneuraminic acid synthetase